MIAWLAVIGFNFLLPGEASALECRPQSTIGNQQAKIDYTYDTAGQLKSEPIQVPSVSSVVKNFGYDDEGNLTSKASAQAGQVWLYSYDHRNRMVKAELRPDMVSPATQVTTFTYDLFDRRIAKETISDLPSANSRSVYRFNGDMIWAEVRIQDSEVRSGYYLSGDRIDQWLAKQTLDPAPSTFDLTWYQSDRLGSITGVADESGETQESYNYSAFGVRSISNQQSTIENSIGFTGRELDPETGLYYYRARYYDPEIGRFISEDPIGFGGEDVLNIVYSLRGPPRQIIEREIAGLYDFNLARYVLNNPEMLTDPTGLVGVTGNAQAQKRSFLQTIREFCRVSRVGLAVIELTIRFISNSPDDSVLLGRNQAKSLPRQPPPKVQICEKRPK